MASGVELEIATRKRLLDAPGMAALVAQRIDWGVRPGAARPAITLTRIAGEIGRHFKGESLQETRVQVDVWANDYVTAAKIAHLVKVTLEPAITLPAIPPNMGSGVRFERGFADQPDPATEDTPTGIVHRARMDVRLWWALTEEEGI